MTKRWPSVSGAKIADEEIGPKALSSAGLKLSIRQRDVLELLLRGETNKAIARRLNLSQSTVNVHMRRLMKVLGAKNRTQVVLRTMDLIGLDATRPGRQ